MHLRNMQTLLMVAIGAFAGCDQRPAAPPATMPAAVAAALTETSRPTTQDLLSGPYKEMLLPGLPIALQVPQSWKITQAGPLSLLEGPTPADTATIQFAQRDPLRAEDVQTFIDRLRQEGERQNGNLKLVEFREAGNGVQVLERRWSERPVIRWVLTQYRAHRTPMDTVAEHP